MTPERLTLVSINDSAICYALEERDVDVRVIGNRPVFPHAQSSNGETTGDDSLDAEICRLAQEEFVRYRAASAAASRLSRRAANGLRDDLDAGYWDAA